MSDIVVKYKRRKSQSTKGLSEKYVTYVIHDTTQVYGGVDAQCHTVLITTHNGGTVSDYRSLQTLSVTNCRSLMCFKSIMWMTRN